MGAVFPRFSRASESSVGGCVERLNERLRLGDPPREMPRVRLLRWKAKMVLEAENEERDAHGRFRIGPRSGDSISTARGRVERGWRGPGAPHRAAPLAPAPGGPKRARGASRGPPARP